MELFKDSPPNRDNNGTVIEICQVADHLGVKRRRIYDVINILESIDIVCRVKKNTYRWHGQDELLKFFAKLQYEGLQERAGVVQTSPVAKTKGMAQTCRKLIQIFLVTGRTEIALTDAAEEVLGPLSPAEEANVQRAMKTKVRRMYDIANVLQSIGILVKENVGSTSLQNKPSFRWVYPKLPSEMGNYLSIPVVPEAPVIAPSVGVPTTFVEDMATTAVTNNNEEIASTSSSLHIQDLPNPSIPTQDGSSLPTMGEQIEI